MKLIGNKKKNFKTKYIAIRKIKDQAWYNK